MCVPRTHLFTHANKIIIIFMDKKLILLKNIKKKALKRRCTSTGYILMCVMH